MRNNYFDVLKAFAILAVVLYHLGFCQFGYLGVDLFFVVAGFFTCKSIDNQLTIGNRGGYFHFIVGRLLRLWPLLLFAGAICLGYGYVLMLPDDLENMSQSIVATNFFSNNILQAITTKNYWDVVNEYKPLMHTWYVGILMQFYIVVPLFLFVAGKVLKENTVRNKVNTIIIVLIGIISFVLHLLETDVASKFYFLPYRLWEFCAGGLAYYLSGKCQEGINKKVWVNVSFTLIYMVLLSLLFLNVDIIPRHVKQILVVGLSVCLLVLMPGVIVAQKTLFSNKWIASIGVASYSIFVWHQVVLAFIRYSFTNNLTNLVPLVAFVIITSLLSLFSYSYIEQLRNKKTSWIVISLLFVTTTIGSLLVYINAGVVRDVPELEVKKGYTHRGMWAEFCDRGYQYDCEFTENDHPKWYVIGNSFGRDMVNIILESPCYEVVEVVYSDMKTYKDKRERFEKADVVFLSTLGVNEQIIDDVQSRMNEHCKLYIVGEKNFGENNGQVYRHRMDNNYYDLSVVMENGYEEKNDRLKKLYQNNYIDMIEMVRKPDGTVRVFTDDGLFISQDCRHLTRAGAQYYAQMIDWNKFID